jgi:hypothetical protein
MLLAGGREYLQGGGEESRQSQVTVCIRSTDEVSRQLVGYAAWLQLNSPTITVSPARLTPSRKEAFADLPEPG